MFSYIIYFYMNVVNLILMILMVLVGVSFLTLLERKSLGYMQDRKGPNKVFMGGLIQPFSDAIKLFSKEFFYIFSSNKIPYIFSPIFILSVSMLSWGVTPMCTGMFSFNLGVLFMFCSMSLSSYPILLAGWSSNSNYSMIGSLRSVAQLISYEVSLFMVCLNVILMSEGYSLYSFFVFQSLGYMFFMFPVCLMFLISSLAELNRMPFDFIEGESELVSGFNTEYFGWGFSLIFMGEYCSIIFMSMIFCIFFLGLDPSSIYFLVLQQIIIFLVIMVRGILPRVRYDELMNMCWKVFLPVSMNYVMFSVMFKWMLMVFYI